MSSKRSGISLTTLIIWGCFFFWIFGDDDKDQVITEVEETATIVVKKVEEKLPEVEKKIEQIVEKVNTKSEEERKNVTTIEVETVEVKHKDDVAEPSNEKSDSGFRKL